MTVGESIGIELDLDHPPASATSEVETGVDGQAMEPGVEPVGVTQPRQVVPGPDERLLDRVAGQLRVAEDEAGDPVQPRDGIAGELGEGVMIALPRSLDESSLVHDRLGFGAPMVDVLDSVWRPDRRIRFLRGGARRWRRTDAADQPGRVTRMSSSWTSSRLAGPPSTAWNRRWTVWPANASIDNDAVRQAPSTSTGAADDREDLDAVPSAQFDEGTEAVGRGRGGAVREQ